MEGAIAMGEGRVGGPTEARGGQFVGMEATRTSTSFLLSLCCFIPSSQPAGRQGMLFTPSLSRNEGSERGDVQGHQPSWAPNPGWSDLKVRPFLLQLLPPLTDGLVLLLTQDLEGRRDLENREAWERVLNEQRLRGHHDESPELTFQENLTLTPAPPCKLHDLGWEALPPFPHSGHKGRLLDKEPLRAPLSCCSGFLMTVSLSPKYHQFNYAMS